ncbi:hypothetical protein J2X72_000750 [Phyllobacterium sp. 1468]|uniref:hypothetical protein n=1 Tax=Phyllobacterium sp. 1468 TaxID=2817759 RepID=UPI00285AC22E|nr:hypothetical protein [Phyllobacterium sp. 1468]MDR6631979.1 hypothetical protein [Phyllobacterium sp. 1468]
MSASVLRDGTTPFRVYALYNRIEHCFSHQLLESVTLFDTGSGVVMVTAPSDLT